MWRISVVAGFLTLGVTGLWPTPSRADYQFCNHTSYVLEAAIAHQDLAIWQIQGWFRIDPGDCTVVLSGPVDDGPYFVYAQSHRAHAGAQKEFSGSMPFCTVAEDFLIEDRRFCALRGYDSRDFYKVEVKAGADWTTSFTSVGYGRAQARVAGAERLLAELGLFKGRVDGQTDSGLEEAISAFRQTHAVPGERREINMALFDTLLNEAEKNNSAQGLTLCNETMDLIWASVAREIDGYSRASGWFQIQVGECTQVVRGALSPRAQYYLYAEAVTDKTPPRNWSGKYMFCTRKTRFTLDGSGGCEAQGAAPTGFMRLDFGGRNAYSYTLKSEPVP
jgi:uncharacterized membrane protein